MISNMFEIDTTLICDMNEMLKIILDEQNSLLHWTYVMFFSKCLRQST